MPSGVVLLRLPANPPGNLKRQIPIEVGWGGASDLHISQRLGKANFIGLGTLQSWGLRTPKMGHSNLPNRVRSPLLSLVSACFKFEMEKSKRMTKGIVEKLSFGGSCGALTV